MADYATQIDVFMAALSAQESGGNPQARNPSTGAYGQWQILESNWPSWAQEAGLGRDAPQTPENQRRVARFKMLQYFNDYGSWDAVAIAWFAGPSRAQRYVNGDESVLSLSDGNMTVGGYIAKMRQGMQAAQEADPYASVPALPEGVPEVDIETPEKSQERLVSLMRTISDMSKSETPTPFDDDQSGISKFFDSLKKSEDDLVPSFDTLADAQSAAQDEAEQAAEPVEMEAAGTPLTDGPDPRFVSSLDAFIAASGGRITIKGGGDYGYRSNAEQTQLWEDALAKYGDPEIADNWVARPGNSNHEKGVAADLQFADDAARRWAHDNAAKYGLVFPLGNEPWHVELAGVR